MFHMTLRRLYNVSEIKVVTSTFCYIVLYSSKSLILSFSLDELLYD